MEANVSIYELNQNGANNQLDIMVSRYFFYIYSITAKIEDMSHLSDFRTILELKRYSENTIKTYIGLLEVFKSHYNINEDHFKNYEDRDIITSVISLVKTKSYSISSQKQLIGALSLFYKEVFKRLEVIDV